MIIYLSMMVWVLLVGLFSRKRKEPDRLTGNVELRASRATAFFCMGYIVFFIGLRSAGADTSAYISSFQNTVSGWSAFVDALRNLISLDEAGFTALEILIKTLFGDHYHVWLFFLAAVSGYAVARTLRRHTKYFIDAMMLFLLMGTYGWMINGVRQFVAVSLSFAAVERLVQRKWKSYILIILLLATIHRSVLVMILIYFLVNGRAWNKRTLLCLLAGVAAVLFIEHTTDLWDSVMTVAGYSQDVYTADDGSSLIRTLIFAVPPVLAFLFRKQIEENTTPLINVCINMSVLAAATSLVANVTSGILMGRMPIYFSIYNLILLPWLVRRLPKRLATPVYLLMYLCYFILYFVDGGLGYYYSDVLGIYLT